MAGERLSVQRCIAGGGPAGMMLGLLLARAGVDVVVLEKHADFLRDFRGDTIHPSTLEVMRELGLLEGLLALPHQEVPRLEARIGSTVVPVADFTHLPTRCAFMPQRDFLDFLARPAARLSRSPDDPANTIGRFDAGRIFIMINSGEQLAARLRHPQGRLRADP